MSNSPIRPSHPSSLTSPSFSLSHSPLVAHPPPKNVSPLAHGANTSFDQPSSMPKALQPPMNSLISSKGMIPGGLPPWACDPMLTNAFNMFGGMLFPGFQGGPSEHPFAAMPPTADKYFPFGFYSGNRESDSKNSTSNGPTEASYPSPSPSGSDKKEDKSNSKEGNKYLITYFILMNGHLQRLPKKFANQKKMMTVDHISKGQ